MLPAASRNRFSLCLQKPFTWPDRQNHGRILSGHYTNMNSIVYIVGAVVIVVVILKLLGLF